MNKESISLQGAAADAFNARGNAPVQSAEIFGFIPVRLFWLSSAFPNALRKLNHLVDGLFAVQAHDIVIQQLAPGLIGFARDAWKHLQEHWEHHFRPALPDQ